jgi:hypothetical protein
MNIDPTIPIYLWNNANTAYQDFQNAKTTLVITTHQFYKTLFPLWNIYMKENDKLNEKPRSIQWNTLLQHFNCTQRKKQARINRHMKFIYQHSLELYSILWMKDTNISRFATMKQGDNCMNKWNENNNMTQQNIIIFGTWIQEYCITNTTSRTRNVCIIPTKSTIIDVSYMIMTSGLVKNDIQLIEVSPSDVNRIENLWSDMNRRVKVILHMH